MQKILISACLFGENVRYDGGNCLIPEEIMSKWIDEGRLVPICPEVAGGLPVPRPPCEQKDGRVLDAQGVDYTDEFHTGAQLALALVKKEAIQVALLKERSPSCGVNLIYDGNFTSNRIEGSGVTASLLKAQGLAVFSEMEIDDLLAYLEAQE